jgi:hypothetical protein
MASDARFGEPGQRLQAQRGTRGARLKQTLKTAMERYQ